MQKISSYLYPNRVQILANVASFNVEYTSVYQRNIKIYKGINNIIEFDIKNADQKRIDLSTLADIRLNVMDAAGNELDNSPYDVIPTNLKGIATAIIPAYDLSELSDQYLTYSLSAFKNGQEFLLYSDTRFSGAGTIELSGNAMPKIRKSRIFDTFTAEIDLKGQPIYHTSAIPVKFYEAIPTEILEFEIHASGFVGSVWIDATKNSTINAEAFRSEGKPYGSWTRTVDDGPYTGIVPFGSNISVKDYNFVRVSFDCPTMSGVGASFIVTRSNNTYNVVIKSGGTAYSVGSMIKVPGDQLGGTNGVNDLIISVRNVDASSAGFTSSYAVSSISTITWTGIAASGEGTHLVTGVNVSGLISKVVVKSSVKGSIDGENLDDMYTEVLDGGTVTEFNTNELIYDGGNS